MAISFTEAILCLDKSLMAAILCAHPLHAVKLPTSSKKVLGWMKCSDVFLVVLLEATVGNRIVDLRSL